jgi:histidinol-phosphatase
MGPDLVFALELADAADAISLPRFRANDLAVRTKPDLTPVSETDTAVERELRRLVSERREGEGFLGEEDGVTDELEGAARWIVDPIDATKNYVRGVPLWATLIALEDRVAVVSAPALGRRWWAARGEGAWRDDGERLRVSRVARIEDAVLTYTSLRGFDERFHALAGRAWAARGFGDFWQYMLLAEGAVDVCVEATVSPWDLAAPKLVVEEAGGVFTDLGGTPTAAGGSALASNGLLHDAALAVLRAQRSG